MLPFIPLMLGGAGLGALLNKKDPLKGALLGAGLGAGGAALPGLLGAGGATAGIAPGATAATEAGMLGAETGINSMGYLAPEMTGTIAEQAAAPVVDMSSKAGMFDTMNHQTGGFLGRTTDTMNKLQKPLGTAASAATLSKTLMPQDQPIQGGLLQQPMATGPQGLSQLAVQNQQLAQQRQQDDMQRRMAMRQRIQRMGGMG